MGQPWHAGPGPDVVSSLASHNPTLARSGPSLARVSTNESGLVVPTVGPKQARPGPALIGMSAAAQVYLPGQTILGESWPNCRTLAGMVARRSVKHIVTIASGFLKTLGLHVSSPGSKV